MQGEKHILAVLLFKSVGFVLFVVVVVSIQNISPSFDIFRMTVSHSSPIAVGKTVQVCWLARPRRACEGLY